MMKNIGIAIIMLGGAGLIFIKTFTPLWYVAPFVVLLGYILMMRGDHKRDK